MSFRRSGDCVGHFGFRDECIMAMSLCELLVVSLLARLCFIGQTLMKRPSPAVMELTSDTGGIHHFWTEAI